MKVLASRLRSARVRIDKTQEQVAEAVGVGQTTYSSYEVGRRKPSYKVLQKLSEYLGVSADYLLGNTDDPQGIAPGKGADAILQAIDLDDEEAIDLLKTNLLYKGEEISESKLKDILNVARIMLNSKD
ncbi:DNA-binding XRE family transcriptional regulator [Paenibacillus cellulosilyticus]|uniref:DNA-binding XRE family transcriptional regulator n=1 Tax=Paenibacillus cellulosilyticus TaxID=375489 RepID=A0A2V2YQK3_9BACL|nr:helix-turn-helix transcriptional regulator [Paenibacillus cellulosilyticus]PWV92009.1 DNA-binding XRE family transcriptional regulator [Paenibacillus cellulosilyticus]